MTTKDKLEKIAASVAKAVEQEPNFNTERIKRQLWADLQRLKRLHKKEHPESDSKDDPVMQKLENLERQLTLYPHLAKPTSRVLMFFRAMSAAIMNVYLFMLFLVIIPLRFFHPLLRKLGIKNNYLPMDLFQRLWGFCMCSTLGLEVNVEGFENIKNFAENSISSIGTFQHSSQVEVFAIFAKSPVVFKWVGKKSLLYIPLVGQMGRLLGMVFIDRSNREKAIASIKAAARQVHKWKRSIAIAPEGTRTLSGQLGEFKKGAFHLALEAKVPITPIICFGGYHLWHPKSILPQRTGQVTLRFLPPIDTSKYSTDDYDALLEETREVMLQAMADPPKEIWKPLSARFAAWSAFVNITTLVSFVFLCKYLFF